MERTQSAVNLPAPPTRPVAQIHINTDRTKAFLNWDGCMTLEEISTTLEELGVVYGIDHASIEAALAGKQSDTEVCIANGLECVPKEAARVELLEEAQQTSGTIDVETQCMDYRERGGVHSVKIGDPVGTWFPRTKGTPGKGVDGQAIEPKEPAEKDQWRGDFVRAVAGPDGTLDLFSEIKGVIRMGPSGDVYVTDVFEVKGDVDLSCGNLQVAGSIHVVDTIRNGFRVHAGQDIHVDIAIENADVNAGKSLVVGAGIYGGDIGKVRAGELIKAKFSQNANMRSGGDIVLSFDTNSTIEATRRIIATEGEGRLRGGVYFAGECIIAKELGSPNGTTTRVQVGMGPKEHRELARIKNDLRRAQAKSKKVQKILEEHAANRAGRALTKEQADKVRTAMKDQRELIASVANLELNQSDLEAVMKNVNPLAIRIEKTVHAGVQIQIGNAFLKIENTLQGCTFRRDAETEEITCI